MKKIITVIIFIISIKAFAQLSSNTTLVVPEFGNKIIKTYQYTSANSIAPINSFTINLTTLPNGLATNASPNCVAMYGNDLFVTLTNANQRIYKFPNYGNNPTQAIANVSQITNIGSDYVGIAFDTSGNLYTSEGSYLDTHLVKYTQASNYATRIDLGNGGISSYFANITFDTNGNLWASDYKNNRIVAIKAANLSVPNITLHSYFTNSSNWTVGGTNANTTSTLQLKTITTAFSQPEGIAFDNNGNLWVANNNDSTANQAPTLVMISVPLQNTILATAGATFANPNDTNSINGFKVWNLPSSVNGPGQLGGLQIDKTINRIFVNEQVSGKGMWFDIATLSNIADNFSNYELNITSTNPGNGGLFLANNSQILKTEDFNLNSIQVSIYPNPASDQLTIKTKETVKQVIFFDIQGRKILTVENENTIDISNLINGVYFISATSEQGKATVRFIKK